MAKNATARKNLTGLDLIDANIESITKRGQALKKDVHTTMVMIVDHAIAHGDDTRVRKLVNAVRHAMSSSMSAALITWVTTYTTFIRVNENPTEEQKAEFPGQTLFYSIPLKALKADGLEKAIIDLKKPVTSKAHKVNDKPLIYPAGMNARDLPFYEAERDVPQVAVDFQKKFHDMLISTMRTFKDMQKSDYKGRGIVNLDAEKLTRLADTAIALGFVTAEEVDGFNIRVKEADGGEDLAADAERHSATNTQQAEIVPAEKVRRGRKPKTQENEPVADAA